MEFRVGPLIKGVLSVASPAFRSSHRSNVVGTGSSLECYGIFLRHFSRLAQFTDGQLPKAVAEIGPGNSIGTGLAAVIAGSERYIGLDLQNHTDPDLNLRLFDELVALFRNRTPIPRDVDIATEPVDWAFPVSLQAGLDRALNEDRLAAIRRDVVALSGRFVGFAAPWMKAAAVEPHGIDWIFSHSVMEHVDDLDATYACCATWLTPGGWMTHENDYSSHGLTRHWNGQWGIGPTAWRLIRGRRAFLINRLPHQVHRELLAANDFDIVEDRRVRRTDGLPPARFAPAFAIVGADDAETHISFVVCRHRADMCATRPADADISIGVS